MKSESLFADLLALQPNMAFQEKIDAAVEKVWSNCWCKWSRKPKAEHAEEWCATISTRLRFMIRHIGSAASKTPTKKKESSRMAEQVDKAC